MCFVYQARRVFALYADEEGVLYNAADVTACITALTSRHARLNGSPHCAATPSGDYHAPAPRSLPASRRAAAHQHEPTVESADLVFVSEVSHDGRVSAPVSPHSPRRHVAIAVDPPADQRYAAHRSPCAPRAPSPVRFQSESRARHSSASSSPAMLRRASAAPRAASMVALQRGAVPCGSRTREAVAPGG